MLFMIPRIHTDIKKLAYFGMKFENDMGDQGL